MFAILTSRNVVDKIYNGMPANELTGAAWRKSIKSGPQGGNCALLARVGDDEIAVSNSRFPKGPALIYTVAEVQALVQGAKDGEFDDMIA
jgi:hypothetical protein